MTSNIRMRAEELAQRQYTEIMFRDETTDGDHIFMAVTPELEGCVAQGESIRDAQENLRLFRIDYIEHLLEHDLHVPYPAWMATSTGDIIPFTDEDNIISETPDKAIQPEHQEQMFEALLKIESNLVMNG